MGTPTTARRCVSLLAALAVLAGPLAVPLLHAAEPRQGARVESSHDPDHCRVVHDHLACLQLQSSAPLPGGELGLPTSLCARATGPRLRRGAPALPAVHAPDLPRAPPTSPPRA